MKQTIFLFWIESLIENSNEDDFSGYTYLFVARCYAVRAYRSKALNLTLS